MINYPFPHSFMVIEGNIGAGKTTLSKKLTQKYGARLILEKFTDNPFLPHFYKNPDRYAFPVELFFMTERHKQVQEELFQLDLFKQNVIADYFFIKSLLFAKNNLRDEEFRLFQRLFDTLNNSFPKPDLLVYLHRPIPMLLKNINKRGRKMEQSIDASYLQKIQFAYFDYFRNVLDIPILILDVENADFENNTEHFKILEDCLRQKYRNGMNQIRILN